MQCGKSTAHRFPKSQTQANAMVDPLTDLLRKSPLPHAMVERMSACITAVYALLYPCGGEVPNEVRW